MRIQRTRVPAPPCVKRLTELASAAPQHDARLRSQPHPIKPRRTLMNMSISKTGRKTAAIAAGILGLLAAAGASAGAPAGNKEDEISFDLVPNPLFVDCLRANYSEEPHAHATV